MASRQQRHVGADLTEGRGFKSRNGKDFFSPLVLKHGVIYSIHLPHKEKVCAIAFTKIRD